MKVYVLEACILNDWKNKWIMGIFATHEAAINFARSDKNENHRHAVVEYEVRP
jgi:hypothetical protein